MKIYAGIGSREITPEVEKMMIGFGKYFASLGWILRSGGADGSDAAFERGCDLVNGKKEIYLPWRGFNDNKSPLHTVSDAAREFAQKYHPAWDKLSDGAKNLHARNCYQVLGQDLNTPVDFIVCYTKGGKGGGGTGQALRIAKDRQIEIIDLGKIFG